MDIVICENKKKTMCWNGDKGYRILYVLWAATLCSSIAIFPI
jgi:hypothetical protein